MGVYLALFNQGLLWTLLVALSTLHTNHEPMTRTSTVKEGMAPRHDVGIFFKAARRCKFTGRNRDFFGKVMILSLTLLPLKDSQDLLAGYSHMQRLSQVLDLKSPRM